MFTRSSILRSRSFSVFSRPFNALSRSLKAVFTRSSILRSRSFSVFSRPFNALSRPFNAVSRSFCSRSRLFCARSCSTSFTDVVFNETTVALSLSLNASFFCSSSSICSRFLFNSASSCLRIRISTFSATSLPCSSACAVNSFNFSISTPFAFWFCLRWKFRSGRRSCICSNHSFWWKRILFSFPSIFLALSFPSSVIGTISKCKCGLLSSLWIAAPITFASPPNHSFIIGYTSFFSNSVISSSDKSSRRFPFSSARPIFTVTWIIFTAAFLPFSAITGVPSFFLRPLYRSLFTMLSNRSW